MTAHLSLTSENWQCYYQQMMKADCCLILLLNALDSDAIRSVRLIIEDAWNRSSVSCAATGSMKTDSCLQVSLISVRN
jgi:hypothetical protein